MDSKFLTNYTDTTFLATIQSNLRECLSFCFSVSFIKKAGLVLLANDIKAAIERGAEGKLITSTYQNFTDVESLNFFLRLALTCSNFECHLDDECFVDSKNYSTNGFHTKGYIFDFGNRQEIIVGSSNITRYALLKNIEWDLVVQCQRNDEVYANIMAEFNELWNETKPLEQELINTYAQKINFAIERWDMDYDLVEQRIQPNFMQKKALRELNRNRAIGVNRSLVISATGILGRRREGLVFMLWGAPAGRKASLIDGRRHLVLSSAHPSPLSAYRGFFGNKHFISCNEYLVEHGRQPIDW